MSSPSSRWALVLATVLLIGCDHSEPFPPQQPANAPPRGAGNPVRVTYNLGTDLRPTWLPDGSGFYYTQERMDRADEDRCLARMNAGGGSVLEEVCDRSATSNDSIATFEWAAVATDDRMAYLRAGTPLSPPTLATRTLELRLGTRANPTGAVVRSFPYTSPSGTVWSFSFLQWLDATHLLYLAEDVQYVPPCAVCPPDTLRIGVEVVTIDPSTGVSAIVPGTTGATSVARSGSDTIYYTPGGSPDIERRVLSSGAVSVAHRFGDVVRDVTAGGGRLAAITGLGELWLVDPGVSAQPLTAPTLTDFKRPALTPNGDALVVEGYGVRYDTVRVNGAIVAINRIVSTSADLWFFDLP